MHVQARTLPDPTPIWAWPWVECLRLQRLQWSAYEIPVRGLPPVFEGLRIVHLTDLHIDTVWMPAWDKVLQQLAANPPDLILITGDFVDSKIDCRPALPNVRRFLAPLSARLGVWGILGNHDGDAFALPMNDLPVHPLYNDRVILRDGEAVLDLVGWHGVMPTDVSPRVVDELGPKPPGWLRLVMAHFPQQVLTAKSIDADVIFAGHTHGGQVCLPGGRAILSHDPLPQRFAKGVHQFDQTWLCVPRGLGFSAHAVRAFCPAEVIELTLTRA
ncbi:MAG: metallophosphoesterase [Tepidisphaeraceae bacterium]